MLIDGNIIVSTPNPPEEADNTKLTYTAIITNSHNTQVIESWSHACLDGISTQS